MTYHRPAGETYGGIAPTEERGRGTDRRDDDRRRGDRRSGDGPLDYETVSVPVLVIGAGAAGARTAIELAERGVESLVVGKRDHGDAHTTWAAGGINGSLGSLDPDDDWTIHAADTLKEGHFLNDPVAVETVTKAMPDRLRELDEWGTNFDKTDEGRINQRYFGAQSFRRTAFVGDRTGEAILDALVAKARSLDVPYRENVMVTDLLSDGQRVYGAVAVDLTDGRFVLFAADSVVVAAGGFSALYGRHSSRDDENTADGPALAYEAGADLMDLEFVQFHPTGMVGNRYGEEWSGRLVTEAVRGEGGRLYNADGERFMERYSPDQMELDARDVVARAIAREVREGRGTENGGVYLDISHRDADYVRERLPKMVERFASLGVDITEEAVEIAPTAHYTMGGVDIDWTTGETRVEGLYAVGESAAGVHGANRLGGNSLAETVAMAPVVGRHVAERDPEAPDLGDADPADADFPSGMVAYAERAMGALADLEAADGDTRPAELIADLRKLMDDHAGIIRDGDSLREGLADLRLLRDRTAEVRVVGDRTGEDFELALDLAFMLTLAEGLLRGALVREESRGAHFRTDYPEKSPAWRRNILFRRGDTGMDHFTREVAAPSPEVQKALDAGYELDYHHLE
ncbi:L-aspartate oxidase [Halorussus salinus]|uniref:L-aspartate oxidase n=1 Tax=Halorussus salinus TaxID=1364935 RepID=UPI001091D42F|nr:FAD-dependent oxidoreductase [Halorussus salinus]